MCSDMLVGMKRGTAIYGPGVPGRLRRLTPSGRRRLRELEQQMIELAERHRRHLSEEPGSPS
jgi:hypothetical protein